MYKLHSKINNFRYNLDHAFGRPFPIEWFKLVEDGNGNISSSCFSEEELDIFIEYAINNPDNFADMNYFNCTSGEGPDCGIYGRFPAKRGHPYNLILKPNPLLSKLIYPCMEIILLNQQGERNHNYNLQFSVIGHLYE